MPARSGSPPAKGGFKWKKIKFWKGTIKQQVNEEASVGLASATSGSQSGSSSAQDYSTDTRSLQSPPARRKMSDLLRENSILDTSNSGHMRSGITLSTEETLSPSVKLLHEVYDEDSILDAGTAGTYSQALGSRTSSSLSRSREGVPSMDGDTSYSDSVTNCSNELNKEEAIRKRMIDIKKDFNEESTYGNGTSEYYEDDEASGDDETQGDDDDASKEFGISHVIDTLGNVSGYLNCGRIFSPKAISESSLPGDETYYADSRTGTGTEGSFTLDTFDDHTLSTLGNPDFESVQDFYEYMQSRLVQDLAAEVRGSSFDNVERTRLFPTDESSLESCMDQSHIYLMMTNARRERTKASKQAGRMTSLLDDAETFETSKSGTSKEIMAENNEKQSLISGVLPQQTLSTKVKETQGEKWLRAVKEAVKEKDGLSSRSLSTIEAQRAAAQKSLQAILRKEATKKKAS